MDNFKSIPINIILNSNVDYSDKVAKKLKTGHNPVSQPKHLFQEIMYFGCNLCPFICTKDSKITDHIQSVHENQNHRKRTQLKCPGCSNIFHHKLSLRSHLIYDHEVNRNDINKIVNSIVCVSELCRSVNNNQENVEDDNNDQSSVFLSSGVSISSEEVNLSLEAERVVNSVVEEENVIEIFPQNAEEILLPALQQQETEIITNDSLPKVETIEIPVELSLVNITAKIEERKRIHKCCVGTCAVRMADAVNMAYHVKCHFEKIFRCPECSAHCMIWKTLQTHLWLKHKIDMELYSCPNCDYKTYSLAKLNTIHKLIHGIEKPFICDVCGKGYKNTKQLRNHKMVHKRKMDKMIECATCGKFFAEKRMLKVHIEAVHEKRKPFACNYCSYKSATNGALKLHLRLHTGQKPFSCDQCDYTTGDHNSLRRHKSRHTNERKYKCTYCDYACIQSNTYKTHLKTKHPGLETDLLFSCTCCQFKTVNKGKYTIHLASHTENNAKLLNLMISDKATTTNIDLTRPVTNNKNHHEVEFVNIKSDIDEFSVDQKLDITLPTKKSFEILQNLQSIPITIQETSVALISKVNCVTNTNDCIIYPLSSENDKTHSKDLIKNSVPYFYREENVVLEISDK